MNELLSVTETPVRAVEFVASCGAIVSTFDRTQDSGNVSWIVATNAGEFFAKSAGTTVPLAQGRPVPYFDHAGRVRLLRNAVEVAASCDHRSLARLRNVVETGDGPLLVYDRAPGELIGTPREQRADPASAYRRFAALPAERHVLIIRELLDAHVALAAAGWIACDLYDGCLIVDFSTDRLTLIDLDTYVRGPFINEMGRMFGSDRYMARGARPRLHHRPADHGLHPWPHRAASRHCDDRRPDEVCRRLQPCRGPRAGDLPRSGRPLPRCCHTHRGLHLRNLIKIGRRTHDTRTRGTRVAYPTTPGPGRSRSWPIGLRDYRSEANRRLSPSGSRRDCRTGRVTLTDRGRDIRGGERR